MSAYLRRCVTLGANGVINPGSTQDYRRCRDYVAQTKTRWVRLWADWPSLQPEGSAAPDRGTGAWRVTELDRQIAQANADGIEVILVTYRFPRWANGTADLSATADASYQLEDRIQRGADPASRKDLQFKLPSDLSAAGDWGRWIDFLARRYGRSSPDRRAVVSFLEVCNEPNLQIWPQQGPSTTSDPYAPGPLSIGARVADMFRTAREIIGRYGTTPGLMGPGTADRVGDSRLATGYETFTRALLDSLDASGFAPGRSFAWSHHHFTDVEYDQGVGSTLGRTTNRAAAVRGLLTGRWAGWPDADASRPVVLIPEGGARLSKIASVYGNSDYSFLRDKQAELIRRNWDRMVSDGEGAGIGMVGQYLFYTDPYFDSGLCELDGTRRPAYTTWGKLPAYR